MGVSQKEWNGKARAAARKAAAQARKQKAPTEQTISAAYKKAHDKVRNKSPKCKLQNKVRLKRWRESPKGKLLRKRWRESPKGRRSERERNNRRRNILQRAQSKRYLRDALQTKGPISNGWPDAGRIEQKIGPDWVRAEQWRRAAQAYAKGIVFSLLFAVTHEDAAYTRKCKIISFEEYAKQLGMAKEWNVLVGKVKNLSKEQF